MDLRKDLLKKLSSLPSTKPNNENLFINDYSPLSWEYFYDSKSIDKNGFCIYRTKPNTKIEGNDIPYVFFLHGAGYTSLSWAPVAVHIFLIFENTYKKEKIKGIRKCYFLRL